MTTRKKPQQQLSSYFTELLTELEEPVTATSESVEAAPKTRVSAKKISPPPRVKKAEVKANISPEPSPESSSTSANAGAISVLDGSIVDSADKLLKDKSKNAQSHSYSAQVTKPYISKPHMSKPQPPQMKAKAARIEQLPQHKSQVIDEEQQAQQEKLQRLLRNLAPSKNEVEIGLDTQKIIEEKILSHTLDDVDIGIDASLESMGINTPYQWQVLSSEWLENGRPNWAQERFDILLVSVNGVNLAVPLGALDAIYPLEDKLTPLFGQAEWFMGLQKTLIGNINIINTTQFVMPERYDKNAAKAFKYSVAINGSGWGLAVDDIDQPISIDPDDIRWRVNRSQQPWMAGTVKEHMCVLLDIPTLVERLTKKDSHHEPELVSD